MAGSVRAVLDANVFVSGVLTPRGPCGEILRSLRAGAFALVTSEEINEEILSVLARPRIRRRYRIGEEMFDLAVILSNAAVLLARPRKVRASPDPDDDKRLAAAVEGRARFLVTGDKTDLLALREFRGVAIVGPQEFIRALPI